MERLIVVIGLVAAGASFAQAPSKPAAAKETGPDAAPVKVQSTSVELVEGGEAPRRVTALGNAVCLEFANEEVLLEELEGVPSRQRVQAWTPRPNRSPCASGLAPSWSQTVPQGRFLGLAAPGVVLLERSTSTLGAWSLVRLATGKELWHDESLLSGHIEKGALLVQRVGDGRTAAECAKQGVVPRPSMRVQGTTALRVDVKTGAVTSKPGPCVETE